MLKNVIFLHECTEYNLQKPFTYWSSPKIDEILQGMFLSSSACIHATVSCSFKAIVLF